MINLIYSEVKVKGKIENRRWKIENRRWKMEDGR